MYGKVDSNIKCLTHLDAGISLTSWGRQYSSRGKKPTHVDIPSLIGCEELLQNSMPMSPPKVSYPLPGRPFGREISHFVETEWIWCPPKPRVFGNNLHDVMFGLFSNIFFWYVCGHHPKLRSTVGNHRETSCKRKWFTWSWRRYFYNIIWT